MQKILLEEKIFTGGDLNGHVGKMINDFKSIHDGYGFGATNEEGRNIFYFALAYDFTIISTLFKKRDHYIITFKSGFHKTQIDYFLIRKTDQLDC